MKTINVEALHTQLQAGTVTAHHAKKKNEDIGDLRVRLRQNVSKVLGDNGLEGKIEFAQEFDCVHGMIVISSPQLRGHFNLWVDGKVAEEFIFAVPPPDKSAGQQQSV